jgi:hypothetical protein
MAISFKLWFTSNNGQRENKLLIGKIKFSFESTYQFVHNYKNGRLQILKHKLTSETFYQMG